MSQSSKAIPYGILIGITGLIISVIPFLSTMEEHAGLALLFKLRGVRSAPSDVVVISIAKDSAASLHLPNDPDTWDRSLHARLIDNLSRAGAKVIVFDLFFHGVRSSSGDELMARAIRNSQNTVLGEHLQAEKVSLTGNDGTAHGIVNIERLIPPLPSLARSSLAVAPFPLPKVPIRVNQYWTFKKTSGNMPTLPAVAFQVFALNAYEALIQLLEKHGASLPETIPKNKDSFTKTHNSESIMRVIRDIMQENPVIVRAMLSDLNRSDALSLIPKDERLLTQLIKLYSGPDNRVINYYGPPRSITTVPYYQALRTHEMMQVSQPQLDFNGKAVFVGVSERLISEQVDGHYTVFSQPDGLDIGGVEIAATAFANLLDDSSLRPLPQYMYLLIILIWGLIIGILCRRLSPVLSGISVAGMCLCYLLAAHFLFVYHAIWSPVVIPLLFQAPLGLAGSVIWNYCESTRERKKIKTAFSYYLPDREIDRLLKDISAIGRDNQTVDGICLYTDIVNYTEISESMRPDELGATIKSYYETVFAPIKQHGGAISNAFGDAVLSIWADAKHDTSARKEACLAALEIDKALHRYNGSGPKEGLSTRIGLHYGQILLGSIGAHDHYEYRPVGDIANTATRIEGLNKHLGTRLLLSAEMLEKLDGFLTREVGRFLLVGKKSPLSIHELLNRLEESTPEERDRCKLFTEALDDFKRRLWDLAMSKFQKLSMNNVVDGPSTFYLERCRYFRKHPPEKSWSGEIIMSKK